MNKKAIIVSAYDRSIELKNLFNSLKKIYTSEQITLIISIDAKGVEDVIKISNSIEWPYGEKKVIIHEQKKGLVDHFIWVGQQTGIYENVIFLEDDLIVSPGIISFAEQIIEFYKTDPNVAAASLYNPIINEITGTKFYQIPDGNDVYFLQQPYWGNIWFKDKWEHFADYLNTYKENKNLLPNSIAKWDKSFKKIFIQYLIENKLYVVTPRTSIVTNQCASGLHSSGRSSYFQTVLDTEGYKYKLVNCKNSLVKYDAFLEIEPDILVKSNSKLSKYQFDIDINGTKKIYQKDYVLTSKPVKSNILAYTSHMKPKELSIIFEVEGDRGIRLTKKEDVLEKRSFYLKRRYLDIKNNYHIGAIASLFILMDTIKYIFEILLDRFKRNLIP